MHACQRRRARRLIDGLRTTKWGSRRTGAAGRPAARTRASPPASAKTHPTSVAVSADPQSSSSEPSEIRTGEPPADAARSRHRGGDGSDEHNGSRQRVRSCPTGKRLAECKFEYGYSEEGPFEWTPCSPLPGEGHKRVHVSAQLSGLIAGSNVFFRIDAKSETAHQLLATRSRRCRAAPAAQRPNPLCLPKRPMVNCPSKRAAAPAESRIGTLRRLDIGGPALARAQRRLLPGLHAAPARPSRGSNTSDCELGGAKTTLVGRPRHGLGTDHANRPRSTTESTHCITVTATANSRAEHRPAVRSAARGRSRRRPRNTANASPPSTGTSKTPAAARKKSSRKRAASGATRASTNG